MLSVYKSCKIIFSYQIFLRNLAEKQPQIIKMTRDTLNPVQFRSVAQACPTLCNLMNRSTPGLPVPHQLLEFTQTHIHRVSDAIQPSHPVVPFSSYPQSLPASESFPMSQLFARGGQSSGVSALALFLPKKSQG